MKRVIHKTETVDNYSDGTTSTIKSERIEEIPSSGLLEAYGFLLLLGFTFFTFAFTYNLVSNIIRNHNHGIQRDIQQYQQETIYQRQIYSDY